MTGKWIAAAVVGLAIGLMLAPAVGQQERPGLQRLKERRERERSEREGAQPENASRGQYKVVDFDGNIEHEQRMLNELAADGWEYVGLVATPTPTATGRPSRVFGGQVAFRRVAR